MHKITGLFKETSKKGNTYLSAYLKSLGLKVIVMKNDYKREGSNDPDYNLFIALNDKPQEKSFDDQDEDFGE